MICTQLSHIKFWFVVKHTVKKGFSNLMFVLDLHKINRASIASKVKKSFPAFYNSYYYNIIQCVRATFTLAVVVTVVNQKSPKSPVGGISPNLWTKTCRVSNSDWKNGITSVISLAQSKLRSIGRRANQPPLTFCPLAWFLGKLF